MTHERIQDCRDDPRPCMKGVIIAEVSFVGRWAATR